MITAGQLSSMRATQVQALPDSCVVTRAGGVPVFDPVTGAYTAPASSTVYTGLCRVRPTGTSDRVVMAGEEPVTLRTYDCTLPHTAATVQVDDFVTVSASADAALVNRPLRVMDALVGSWVTARRLVLEDVLG